MDIYLRLIEEKDLDEYWKVGFESPDKDMFYYTGTTYYPTKEEIKEFIEKSSKDKERKHFLICTIKDKIIGEETGANEYITKPFNVDYVVEKVKSYLG